MITIDAQPGVSIRAFLRRHERARSVELAQTGILFSVSPSGASVTLAENARWLSIARETSLTAAGGYLDQFYLVGTPPALGDFVVRAVWGGAANQTVTVRVRPITPEPPTPPTLPDGNNQGVDTSNDRVALTWFQACAEAEAGALIRRAGMVDRYYIFDVALWFVQFINPTTKVLGVRRVVPWTDWKEEEFRAIDWTYKGIAGQLPTAGQASRDIPSSLGFPR
jgi:hypothetical protein